MEITKHKIIMLCVLVLLLILERIRWLFHTKKLSFTAKKWNEWFPPGTPVQILNGKSGGQLGTLSSEDAWFIVERMLFLGIENDFNFDKPKVELFLKEESPPDSVRRFLHDRLKHTNGFIFHWKKVRAKERPGG